MGVVEVAIVEPNTTTERHNVFERLLAERGVDGYQPEQLKRDDFGKPYLELNKRLIGYNYSSARFSTGSFGLIAIVDDCALGIDIEQWTKQPGNEVFLESIAAPEDERVRGMLGKCGHDVGIALWVIKEAALKCSGEVMLEPSHLAVSMGRDGLFAVGPSQLAKGAILECKVALYELQAKKWPDNLFLCALAVPSIHEKKVSNLKNPKFKGVNWTLSAVGHATHAKQ